jgi:hypothetical protein
MTVQGDTREPMLEHYHPYIGDTTAIAITVGTIMDWLPSLAALLSIIWLALRIWADPQVQCWFRKRRCDDVDKS